MPHKSGYKMPKKKMSYGKKMPYKKAGAGSGLGRLHKSRMAKKKR